MRTSNFTHEIQNNHDSKENSHFIYGAQYYRNPTPDRSQWASDLRNMKELGLRDVKFWVQWRANHVSEEEFDFSDIDELMDLAYENGLRVTLNVIFDVAPVWLLRKYSDSVQVTADGLKVVQTAPGHRQLGGFPGACYNHPEALGYRKAFLSAVAKRYSSHPAMYMWDVWNEPEQCGTYRYVNDNVEKVTCYCDHCRAEFICWLKEKYGSIGEVNRVWGKCFPDFESLELPNNIWNIKDFSDFKLFHLATMTKEANWRIATVKAHDRAHPVYLHVVPNTSTIFNAVSGVNDFDMARNCDVFASTNFAPPIWSVLTMSAGRGKRCYNVECHIGSGSIKMHQKPITYKELVNDFAPQIGAGIRGFMFWQYRPEVLGHEAPAWGMTNLDGSVGSIGEAAKRFGERVASIENELQEVFVPTPEIAIWKGVDNELFQYASQATLNPFGNAFEAYINSLYSHNYNLRVVDDRAIIENDLQDIKLLIMPECYSISHELFAAVDGFVKNGGTLLCEAHFAGYDTDNGRHSTVLPGCGAKEAWGISECETTSSYRLEIEDIDQIQDTAFQPDTDLSAVSDDLKKALKAYGATGGKYYPAILSDGGVITMCERVAFLEAEDADVIATCNNKPIIISKEYGSGRIYYCGSNIGEGASMNGEAFEAFVCKIAKCAGVKQELGIDEKDVHIDRINQNLIAVNNMSDKAITLQGRFNSVFYDKKSVDSCGEVYFVLEAHSADVLWIED